MRTPSPRAQAAFSFAPSRGSDTCPECGQPLRGCIEPTCLRLDLLAALPTEEATAILRCYLGKCGGL